MEIEQRTLYKDRDTGVRDTRPNKGRIHERLMRKQQAGVEGFVLRLCEFLLNHCP